MINIRSIFCHHDYMIQEIQKGQSEAEYLVSIGLKPNTHTSFKKCVLTWLWCTKCHNVKVLKNRI